jgi:membrane associated rhomboid family serine protease
MSRYPGGTQFSIGPVATPAVKFLIISCVAAFILQFLTAGAMLPIFGLVPYLVTHNFFVWQLATYIFLHGGLMHLIVNMFGLWMFGSPMERRWGTPFFVRYFFITGIGAGLLSVLVEPGATGPTIGASGAIYGVLLAYGITFPNETLLLYFVLPVKAKYVVAGLGIWSFLSALASPGSPIAHMAHLGGMVIGFLYLKGWMSPLSLRQRYLKWRMRRLRQKFEVYSRRRRPDDYSVH